MRFLFFSLLFLLFSCASNKNIMNNNVETIDDIEASNIVVEGHLIDYNTNESIPFGVINMQHDTSSSSYYTEQDGVFIMSIDSFRYNFYFDVTSDGYIKNIYNVKKVSNEFVEIKQSSEYSESDYYITSSEIINDTLNIYCYLDRVPTSGVIVVEESMIIHNDIENNKGNLKTVDRNNIVKSSNVSNTSNDAVVSIEPKYPVGRMAYTVPDTMKVGRVYDVTLRITKEKNELIIIKGMDTVNTKMVIDDIRVSSVMTAQLIDIQGGFEIKELSTPEQNVEDFGFTEWRWSVKPVKSGTVPMRLIIKVRIFSENGDYLKDIPVFEKNITVETNVKYNVSNFFSESWQWFMSTLLIPIFVFLYKKRKEKKESAK